MWPDTLLFIMLVCKWYEFGLSWGMFVLASQDVLSSSILSQLLVSIDSAE